MKKNSIVRALSAIIAALALTACTGGGGGDGSTNYMVSTSAGEGGTITPASSAVASGETATFTITPSTGYHVDTVSGCGGSFSGTYATGAVTADCTVNARFALNVYTVTAPSGANGALTPASQTVNHGATTSFTVAPNIGYSISSVTGCNGSLSGSGGRAGGGAHVQREFAWVCRQLNAYVMPA